MLLAETKMFLVAKSRCTNALPARYVIPRHICRQKLNSKGGTSA